MKRTANWAALWGKREPLIYTSDAYVLHVWLIRVFLGSSMNSRYRRAFSNNCTDGALLKYSPTRQKCPSQAPRGLQLFTSEGTLVATLDRNVTFLVFLEEVLTLTLSKATPVCTAGWRL